MLAYVKNWQEDFENLAEMYKKLSINLGIESGGQ